MDRSSKSHSSRTPCLLSQQAVQSLSCSTSPWTARSQALVSLVSCSKAVREDPSRADSLANQIQSLSQPLAICVSDLRSVIVRQSCEAIQSLATALGPKLADAAGSDLIPALLRRASTRKMVMRESAAMAATALLDHGAQGVSKSVLLNITASIMERSGPAPVRAAASRYLGLLLQKDCPSVTEVGRQIGNAIQSGCSDADDSVRAASRDNLRYLRTLDETRYEEIFDSLERKVQALVNDSSLANKTPRSTPIHRSSIIPPAANVYPSRRAIPSRNAPMVPSTVPRPSVAKPAPKIPATAKKEEVLVTLNPPVTKATRPTMQSTAPIARRPSEFKAFSARRRETIEKQIRDREGSKNVPSVEASESEKVVRKRLVPRCSTLPPKCPPIVPSKPSVLPPRAPKKSAITQLPVQDTVKHLAVSGSRKRTKAPVSRASVGASRTRPVSKISRRPTGIPRVTKARGSIAVAASKNASLKPRMSVPVAPATTTRPWNLPPPKSAASKPRTFRRSVYPTSKRGGTTALLKNDKKRHTNINSIRQEKSIGVSKQNAARVSMEKDLRLKIGKEKEIPVEKADNACKATKESGPEVKALQTKLRTTTTCSSREESLHRSQTTACEDNSNVETNDVKGDCQGSQPVKSPSIRTEKVASNVSRRLSESADSSHVPKPSEDNNQGAISQSTESAPLLTLDNILEESSTGSVLSTAAKERKSVSNSSKLGKLAFTSSQRKSIASSTHSSRAATAKAHSRPFTISTSTSSGATKASNGEGFTLSQLCSDGLDITTPKKCDPKVKKGSISFLLGSDITPKATTDNSDAVSETAENNQVQLRLPSTAEVEESSCASPQSHCSAVSTSNFKKKRAPSLPKSQGWVLTPKTLAEGPVISPPQTLAKACAKPPVQRLSTTPKAPTASPLQCLPPLTSRTLMGRRRSSAATSSSVAGSEKTGNMSNGLSLKRAPRRVIRAPSSSNASFNSRPSIASDAVIDSSKRKSSLGTAYTGASKIAGVSPTSSYLRKQEKNESVNGNASSRTASQDAGNVASPRNGSTSSSQKSSQDEPKMKRSPTVAVSEDKENVLPNTRLARVRTGEGRRFGQDLTMRQSVMNGEGGESFEAKLQKSNAAKDKLGEAFACASESLCKPWEERLAALGHLTKVFATLDNAKVENVERVADLLSKFIGDVHVKVVASGLDAAFELFLSTENTTLLFKALERHPLLIRGIIGLLNDKRELARLAAQRAIQSFGAVFPGGQQLTMLAKAHEKGNTSRLASESKILLDVLERTVDVSVSARTLEALGDVAALARVHRKDKVRRVGAALGMALEEKFGMA